MLPTKYNLLQFLINYLITENIPFKVCFESQDKAVKIFVKNRFQPWYDGEVQLLADGSISSYCGKNKPYKPNLTLAEACQELRRHYAYNALETEAYHGK